MARNSCFLVILAQFLLGIWMDIDDEIQAQLVSPEVQSDRCVTFRLRAPQAEKVAVQGLAGFEPQQMTKKPTGIWEATVGPLEPELYSYTFDVDGMTVTDPHNRHVKKWLSVASLVEISGDPPLLHERQAVPHGVVHRHIYHSKTTSSERGVFIYTPPGYSATGEDRLPLVLLLHGYGDDESAWLDVGRANWIADNLLAQGKIKPMMIAMPYGHPLPIELRTSFDDYSHRNLRMMKQDMLDDLLPYLAERYRVEADSEQRAIVGLSMGGGQSLDIGLSHLNSFGWIGGFSSAAPQGDLNEQFAQLLTDTDATNRQLNLLWIGCGADDFLVKRNQIFVDWLKTSKLDHTYCETEGGHDWMVWRKYLAEFLPQLFQEG